MEEDQQEGVSEPVAKAVSPRARLGERDPDALVLDANLAQDIFKEDMNVLSTLQASMRDRVRLEEEKKKNSAFSTLVNHAAQQDDAGDEQEDLRQKKQQLEQQKRALEDLKSKLGNVGAAGSMNLSFTKRKVRIKKDDMEEPDQKHEEEEQAEEEPAETWGSTGFTGSTTNHRSGRSTSRENIEFEGDDPGSYASTGSASRRSPRRHSSIHGDTYLSPWRPVSGDLSGESIANPGMSREESLSRLAQPKSSMPLNEHKTAEIMQEARMVFEMRQHEKRRKASIVGGAPSSPRRSGRSGKLTSGYFENSISRPVSVAIPPPKRTGSLNALLSPRKSHNVTNSGQPVNNANGLKPVRSSSVADYMSPRKPTDTMKSDGSRASHGEDVESSGGSFPRRARSKSAAPKKHARHSSMPLNAVFEPLDRSEEGPASGRGSPKKVDPQILQRMATMFRRYMQGAHGDVSPDEFNVLEMEINHALSASQEDDESKSENEENTTETDDPNADWAVLDTETRLALADEARLRRRLDYEAALAQSNDEKELRALEIKFKLEEEEQALRQRQLDELAKKQQRLQKSKSQLELKKRVQLQKKQEVKVKQMQAVKAKNQWIHQKNVVEKKESIRKVDKMTEERLKSAERRKAEEIENKKLAAQERMRLAKERRDAQERTTSEKRQAAMLSKMAE